MATDKAGMGDKYDSKISDQVNKQVDKVSSHHAVRSIVTWNSS